MDHGYAEPASLAQPGGEGRSMTTLALSMNVAGPVSGIGWGRVPSRRPKSVSDRLPLRSRRFYDSG